jgi:hypothetical protein
MRTFLFAGLALFALFVASAAQGQDTPPFAWSSHAISNNPDVCRARAQTAFAREGWHGIHPAGNPLLAVAAFKGPLAGLILCVDSASGIDTALAIIFVTGGGNGQPDAERDRLEYYLGN